MDLLDGLNKDSLDLLRLIGRLAQKQKARAFLVGGPVRDLMLKIPNVDLDITVEGNGMRLAQDFASCYEKAKVQCYPAFKTAHVQSHCLVDFATARKEKYVRPGAFPEVEPSTIKDDLFRRDFTINAMAIGINPRMWGKLFDFFGGREDLDSRRIRVLHNKSFLDDPTRILRAARFKARFGFRMEGTTLKLLKSALKNGAFETIKPQRYLKELNKIRQEKECQEAIRCLKSWDAYIEYSK
ncbi:MAG: CCA tRNA nucleotidyltransferase [Candidatus Omnitrophica bacterium]|nr:CCA tRNA nucleotidyltransferase [Candidatus Omnitrophota bacterium]